MNTFHTKVQCPNTSTMSYTVQKDGLMVLEGKDSSVHWSQNSMSWGGGTPVPPTCYIHTRVGKNVHGPQKEFSNIHEIWYNIAHALWKVTCQLSHFSTYHQFSKCQTLHLSMKIDKM